MFPAGISTQAQGIRFEIEKQRLRTLRISAYNTREAAS